jgi:hypothetical protein
MAGGRWQKGRRKKELKSVGLKPGLERKKLGKRDNHHLLNQNSFFQSQAWKPSAPPGCFLAGTQVLRPSTLCLLSSTF